MEELRIQSDRVLAASDDCGQIDNAYFMWDANLLRYIVRCRIATRREQLLNRRRTLTSAKEQLSEDVYQQFELAQELTDAR